jgi:butyryl-CoA dehydrogenase
MSTPVLDDRNVSFLLHEVLDVEKLCEQSWFADHSRETFDLFLDSARRIAREALLPQYRRMDEEQPVFEDGRVTTHEVMRDLYPKLAELGILTAMRGYDVGGAQLPFSVLSTALAYLYGANLNACGFAGLTLSAGHLIEAFGSDELKETYMTRMYAGEWTGTMALTEPHAGSSLADLRSAATPTEDGHYLLRGSKIFISGGDQTFSENVVHLALARIDGAPAGTGGISLFVVPKLRPEGDELVDNDVATTGIVHKLGWRGLPSVMLGFGERGDCRGWLVGEPHHGLRYMFRMMNEARVGVGISGAATASAAYLSSLEYAKERTQGRHAGQGSSEPPVPIVEHADVRRMLLKQKAIVEGALALVVATARYADVALHGDDDGERGRAQALLDLLTPITKTFPAERGFESNALAVQILGGYGYTSEYLPEAWLRDQKLNSIHEGTTGIQGLDLLGRKVMRTGGASLMTLAEEMGRDVERARAAGVDDGWLDAFQQALGAVQAATMHLGQVAGEDIGAMLRHSTDYLDMLSLVVVGWQWIAQAAVARERLPGAGDADRDFYEGKLRAARYWAVYELPRVAQLSAVIQSSDDAFATMPVAQF